jgi:hypothetical protein
MEIDITKRDILGIIVFALTLLVVYFLLSSSPLDLNVLNFILILALVWLTAIYARAAVNIVQETQKDRRVRYLENRLEKLYSPLKYNPDRITQPPLLSSDPDYSDYYNFWIQIRSNTHLASPNLRGKLEIFFNAIETLHEQIN